MPQTSDTAEKTMIFVHSRLDEYGLSLLEFRLVGRIARRGTMREAVPKLASEFGVSDRTIQRALRVLTKACLISETKTNGNPTVYALLSESQWKPKIELNEIRNEVCGKRVGVAEGVTPETGGF